jgi:hypothetical protein
LDSLRSSGELPNPQQTNGNNHGQSATGSSKSEVGSNPNRNSIGHVWGHPAQGSDRGHKQDNWIERKGATELGTEQRSHSPGAATQRTGNAGESKQRTGASYGQVIETETSDRYSGPKEHHRGFAHW